TRHLGLLRKLDEEVERVPVEQLAAEVDEQARALEREMRKAARLRFEQRADRRVLQHAGVMLERPPGRRARTVRVFEPHWKSLKLHAVVLEIPLDEPPHPD